MGQGVWVGSSVDLRVLVIRGLLASVTWSDGEHVLNVDQKTCTVSREPTRAFGRIQI